MRYRELGDTDIRVSCVAMGCWGIAGGGTWGPSDEADSIATIHAALDAGINFFDTAEGYGDGYSERMLGHALQGRRHEAVIATKVSPANLDHDGVIQACEQSLRRLRVDVIDLYQVHWPSRTVPFADTLAALEKLCEQGKVRAVGVSNFGVGDLRELLAVQAAVRVCTDQLPYSLIWRAIEHEILPFCVDSSIGVLCYSPLVHGLLAGKFTSPADVPDGRARTRHFSKARSQVRHGESGHEAQTFAAIAGIRRVSEEIGQSMAMVAVAWLLHRPGVTSVIAGARRPGQMEQTALAADLILSSEVVDQLAEITDEVKHALGPNPDMWQSEGRIR